MVKFVQPSHCERWITRLWVLVLLTGVAYCVRPACLPTAQESSTRSIVTLLDERHASALAAAEEHVRRFPTDPLGIALAAEAASQQSRHELAIRHYQRLPRDGGQWQFLSEYGQGRRRESQAKISQAEQHYQSALKLNPLDLEANNHLGHILQSSGRVWEAGPHFFVQILLGRCRGDDLLGMSATDRFFRQDERLENAGLAFDPPEPLIQLAMARKRIQENRLSEAEVLLQSVIAVRPELGEAQGRLGRILSDQGNPAAFDTWRRQVPESAQQHPEVWFSLGLQARRTGETTGAARCFQEALLLSPNHLAANVQISACLEQLGQPEIAKKFAERGKVLAEQETNLNLLRTDLVESLLKKTVNDFAALGRYWEATGWCYAMKWVDIPQEFPTQSFAKWQPLAVQSATQNAAGHLPALLLKRDEFPLPRWPDVSTFPKVSPTGSESAGAWSLRENAHEVGIDFTYEEGTTEETRMNHIFSTVGGGLGVLDFDQDGWPDLHLAQANDWRDPHPQPTRTDQLYRNTGSGRFVEISAKAGIAEVSFSHGVAVGDLNQDGFPDLYIGNKGHNRLYLNAGDGTFEDVTDESGTAGDSEDWTTSSVFADFNGDGAPDLYVLNYSPVTPTAQKICRDANGREMSCTPDILLSCPDRLFLNQGDGTFRDATQPSGIVDPNGRGLGVIVWPYGNDHRLGLFIANDTTENYLFVNRGNTAEGTPLFQEEGVVRGVAFDVDGNAQASMGVAAADANRDGELELFVTNFYNDSNTYYSRRADGYFNDLTRPYNLRDASFKMLGFGCQFADLNCDSWPDIIATNGHVDQVTSDGTMDRMPPQVFRNLSGKRFEEVPASALGPFFEGRYLGRGLAVLDWNRDGRADVGISHLHAPFALLTNNMEASPERSPLVIRLIGTRGCREATGATVTVECQGQTAFSLETGGSGFLVTNQRRHEFAGLPSGGSCLVSVRWPDGTTQSWENILSGQEVILIEGHSASRAVGTLR